MNLKKRLRRIRRKWKEETSFKPHVYRVYCKGKPIPIKFQTEQMEKLHRARLERNIYKTLGFKCKIKREKPTKWQKKERKIFGKLTSFLEQFTAG